MPTCLLGLGSNLGDRAGSLSQALANLQSHPQIEILRQSQFRETPPVGGPTGQSPYLNAAAVVRTSLSPQELLKACQEIENSLGRLREEHWGPRTIDIDLLLYDDLVLNEPELQVPHPRMAWRRFVLEPAAEIAAEMVHPVVGWTVGHLLYHLNSTPWYLAIEGPAAMLLAADACKSLAIRFLSDPFHPTHNKEFYYRDPSSHKLQIKLEFLQKRLRELDRADPGWTLKDRLTVSTFWSEFWFEKSAALAKHWLSAEKYEEYMTTWTELKWKVVRPRLLAITSTSSQSLQRSIEAMRPFFRKGGLNEIRFTEAVEQRARKLEERVAIAGGPVLRADDIDRQAALADLTAAVEAMR